jgi:hypothetical protein
VDAVVLFGALIIVAFVVPGGTLGDHGGEGISL